MSTTGEPQPGWYPDPGAPTWSLRYWDGSDWTEQTTPPATGPQPGTAGVRNGPATYPPPQGPPTEVAQPARATSAGTVAYPPTVNVGHGPGNRRLPYLAVAVFLLVLVVGLAIYVVTGTGRDNGKQWFASGVPGWQSVTLKGWPSACPPVVAAWVVPGPVFDGDHPFLAVTEAQAVVPASRTSTQALRALEDGASCGAPGDNAQLVKLSGGAPGLVSSTIVPATSAHGKSLTYYSLWAVKGQHLCWVVFETTTKAFPSEQARVRRVMLDFKGTGT